MRTRKYASGGRFYAHGRRVQRGNGYDGSFDCHTECSTKRYTLMNISALPYQPRAKQILHLVSMGRRHFSLRFHFLSLFLSLSAFLSSPSFTFAGHGFASAFGNIEWLPAPGRTPDGVLYRLDAIRE